MFTTYCFTSVLVTREQAQTPASNAERLRVTELRLDESHRLNEHTETVLRDHELRLAANTSRLDRIEGFGGAFGAVITVLTLFQMTSGRRIRLDDRNGT